MSSPVARPVSTASSRPRGFWLGKPPRPPRKAPVSSSPCGPMSTGMLMSVTSTSPAPFTFSVPSSMAAAAEIVHWEIREKMEESDVEIIIQRAREAYPGVTPRIISDNGPQFIAKDFKEFIRIAGMTHVKTSPYYPQSNGKIERWHKTLKGDCIRVKVPLSLEDARRTVAEYVGHYNHVRLHSAIGYIAPKDKLEGRAKDIFAERDRKLAEARERRQQLRQAQAQSQCQPTVTAC